jgi:hypothetical protein
MVEYLGSGQMSNTNNNTQPRTENWECINSPTHAHHWVEKVENAVEDHNLGLFMCKYCNEEKQFPVRFEYLRWRKYGKLRSQW